MSIYLVQPKGGGHIKVGCSGNIDARHRALARLFPYGIDVLAVIEGGRLGESFIHHCFRPLATSMEWFQSAPPLWRFVLDIQDNGRPDFLPPEVIHDPSFMREAALARYGTPENVLASLGYSGSTTFNDIFSSSMAGGGGRARFAFHAALTEGRLPGYIADLHAPAPVADAA